VQILGTNVVGYQGSASTGPSSSKGKGKVEPRIVLSDTEMSSVEDDTPLQRRMRMFCSDGSVVSGTPLSGQ
jgi:hypothetical protein